MKAKTYTFCICLLLFITVSCKKQLEPVTEATTDKKIASFYHTELEQCIAFLDSISTSKNTAERIAYYKQARQHFKAMEPILAAIDKNNFKSLNAPNILQVQEEDLTDVKIRNPFGFQVIEELLHEEEREAEVLQNAITVTSDRLKLLQRNTHIKLKDYHLIWLIRDQILRTAATGITGFDSPVLGQALTESQYTTQTLITLLELCKDKFNTVEIYDDLRASFKNGIVALNADFDTFDRFSFIKNYTDPQLKLLVKTQDDWQVNFPFEMAVSNTATSFFGAHTLNVLYFSDYKSDTLHLKQKEAFGKALFNDDRLSRNKDMACASCHIEEKAFTDGRKTFDARQVRNSPTLTYSAYQQSFFMDGRAGSLEGQVVGVAENHNEFNLPMDSIVNRVLKHEAYKKTIDSLYGSKRVELNIRHAIASYVRSLNAFNSKFDRNIEGVETSLTTEEKQGFNLFMGKAACATCHFPPLFNGTVPPHYNDTEVELLGVPETKDTVNAIISDDLGRYNVFKTDQRKHFFKTPTVRNSEVTGPYMHNGVYTSLEEVVNFYNRGGGQGIGIHEEFQTLPFDALNLTKAEQASLVAFMKTLTDADFVEE
ncbi:cytochrome-c peroxidase [Winogradskyella arenosi]|uniref:Cytochrome c peroxidase n=1 Tax=Winogradskyella arenosi TaxID=533325 RepID=A0A368ZDJ8_9FLAO|nr:cytochrome c peroxidase [Winogradskyella arenosi]RCW91329.1 cytochrome c peroxidase [Winogradskyella arenosi]